jgi:hypothetical protein
MEYLIRMMMMMMMMQTRQEKMIESRWTLFVCITIDGERRGTTDADEPQCQKAGMALDENDVDN